MKELYDYFEIIRIVDINKFQQAPSGRILNVEYLPGRDKVCVDTEKEFKITTKTKDKDGVTHYDYEIKAVAKLTKEVIDGINNRKAVITLTDGTDIFWMGNKDLPATITLIPNLNNCEINIQCSSLFSVF